MRCPLSNGRILRMLELKGMTIDAIIKKLTDQPSFVDRISG